LPFGASFELFLEQKKTSHLQWCFAKKQQKGSAYKFLKIKRKKAGGETGIRTLDTR
jgi:hypothetical protein